jgi:hypothetical protein
MTGNIETPRGITDRNFQELRVKQLGILHPAKSDKGGELDAGVRIPESPEGNLSGFPLTIALKAVIIRVSMGDLVGQPSHRITLGQCGKGRASFPVAP